MWIFNGFLFCSKKVGTSFLQENFFKTVLIHSEKKSTLIPPPPQKKLTQVVCELILASEWTRFHVPVYTYADDYLWTGLWCSLTSKPKQKMFHTLRFWMYMYLNKSSNKERSQHQKIYSMHINVWNDI